MEDRLSGIRPSQKEASQALTERQSQYLRAYRKTRSAAKAAKLLGVMPDAASEALHRIARKYGCKTIRDLLEVGDVIAANNKNCATASELMRLLKFQEYRCALSGEKLTPNTAELDHKIPKSNGGEDTIENLQWLDRNVNKMKGRLTTEEFVAICRRVVQWAS